MRISRDRGIRFELRCRDLLRAHGYEAERSAQRCGAGGPADILTNLSAHVECKYVSARGSTRIPTWYRTALSQAPAGMRVLLLVANGSRSPIEAIVDPQAWRLPDTFAPVRSRRGPTNLVRLRADSLLRLTKTL